MRRGVCIIFILSAALCLSSVFLSAQMPDWKFFRDREGNGYYYDRALKIRITDVNPFDYTPASSRGTDYYLHKGIEFVKAGRYVEGLYYLKSLKLLPMDNLRVEKNAREASKWINYLQKKHGTRYERYDMESTILLTFSDDKYSIINEKLRYKIVIKKQPRIVKASWKLNGAGYGFKFGFNLEKDVIRKVNPSGSDPEKDNPEKDDFEKAVSDKESTDRGYDCIVGVETRILRGKTGSVGEAEDSWRNEFGRDNFKREELHREDDRVVYTYTYSDGVPFSGIEGIYINGKIIHIVRVLCSSSIKDKVFEEILKPVEEMVLVK